MAYINAKDGTQIFYKDQGNGQPLVFSHGWPLSSDDWDKQIFYFASRGYRCIAHDRRGHGRSGSTWDHNDMDQYSDDLAELTAALELRSAVHIGHSTGGGEVARYIGRHGSSRVSGAVLIGAVPPIMLKTEQYPNGLPMSVFDGFRSAMEKDRAQFFSDVPSGPFYNANRPGTNVSKGVIDAWWRQGMMCDFKSAYDCIKAFSETDFTEDLKKIDVPALVLHGTDDQVVPIENSAKLSAGLIPNAELKLFDGYDHGMCTTHAEEVNAAILEFVQKI